jgi:hypothetical protein
MMIGRPETQADKVVRPRLIRKNARSIRTKACGGIHDIGMISAALWTRRRSGSGRLFSKSIIF